ncbi:MAG: hypothetical protein EBX37_00345 [Alphaproteobacteria bacterium]|nr:hypothetical protein [Alphaproteobacteria bacterium]
MRPSPAACARHQAAPNATAAAQASANSGSAAMAANSLCQRVIQSSASLSRSAGGFIHSRHSVHNGLSYSRSF